MSPVKLTGVLTSYQMSSLDVLHFLMVAWSVRFILHPKNFQKLLKSIHGPDKQPSINVMNYAASKQFSMLLSQISRRRWTCTAKTTTLLLTNFSNVSKASSKMNIFNALQERFTKNMHLHDVYLSDSIKDLCHFISDHLNILKDLYVFNLDCLHQPSRLHSLDRLSRLHSLDRLNHLCRQDLRFPMGLSTQRNGMS